MATRPLNINADFLAGLPSEKVTALMRLHAWPMAAIADKLVSLGHATAANIDATILAYKQFMFFQLLHPGRRSGMYSTIVDEVWHQHILSTQDYERFGAEIFGRFIHHAPCNVMDTSDDALKESQQWMAEFSSAFDGIPLKPMMPPYCQGLSI